MTVPGQKDAWNQFYGSNPRPWRGTISNKIRFPFRKGDLVLDIGCGTGKTSSALIEEGYRVIGVDISDVATDICRRMYGDKMSVICTSADSIPIDPYSVDGIVMIHVLEHMNEDELKASADEAYRILSCGGKMFVRVFHKDDMRSGKGESIDGGIVRGNGIRYRYFTEDELRNVFKRFSEVSTERIEERTKFNEIRSRIEAVFEKPA